MVFVKPLGPRSPGDTTKRLVKFTLVGWPGKGVKGEIEDDGNVIAWEEVKSVSVVSI